MNDRQMVIEMKGNPQKKMTYEDRFDRKYACWVRNHRKAWMFWKRRNRKLFRKEMKDQIRAEGSRLGYEE